MKLHDERTARDPRPVGEILRDLVPPGIRHRIAEAEERLKAKHGDGWREWAWASAGCTHCEGSGIRDGGDCPMCHGPAKNRSCGKCHGAGVTTLHGEVVDCPVCHGAARLRHERIIGDSNIPDKARGWKFADYPPFPDNPGQVAAWEAGQEFVGQPDSWLWICGPVYTGKTFLALLIATGLIDRDTQVTFRTVPGLLQELRATFKSAAEVTFSDKWNALLTMPLLILDDYGRENPTPWVNETLFELLNHRWENLIPTVITSNLEIDALERVNPRLAARITDRRRCRIIRLSQRLEMPDDTPISLDRERNNRRQP